MGNIGAWMKRVGAYVYAALTLAIMLGVLSGCATSSDHGLDPRQAQEITL